MLLEHAQWQRGACKNAACRQSDTPPIWKPSEQKETSCVPPSMKRTKDAPQPCSSLAISTSTATMAIPAPRVASASGAFFSMSRSTWLQVWGRLLPDELPIPIPRTASGLRASGIKGLRDRGSEGLQCMSGSACCIAYGASHTYAMEYYNVVSTADVALRNSGSGLDLGLHSPHTHTQRFRRISSGGHSAPLVARGGRSW